jgi:hypothetical protein
VEISGKTKHELDARMKRYTFAAEKSITCRENEGEKKWRRQEKDIELETRATCVKQRLSARNSPVLARKIPIFRR